MSERTVWTLYFSIQVLDGNNIFRLWFWCPHLVQMMALTEENMRQVANDLFNLTVIITLHDQLQPNGSEMQNFISDRKTQQVLKNV